MYPHQADRLTEALDREGLAALVGTTPANVLYVTGFAGGLHAVRRSPQFAVFTRSGTALVVGHADVPAVVAERLGVDHVAAYGRPALPGRSGAAGDEGRVLEVYRSASPTAVRALAEALAALGVRGGRVGLDEAGMTPSGWHAAIEGLPGLDVVPATSALGMARRVKGPWELECLQRALGIAEEALNAVLQTLDPGTTDQAALVAYETDVIRRGARLLPSVIAAGARTGIPYPPAGERALRVRDLVRFDVGCTFKGYCGRVARTAVVGQPDEGRQRRHDALQAGVDGALAAIKPGAAAADVFDAVRDAVRAGGLPEFAPEAAGWGLGLESVEAPLIAPGVDVALEMGEVVQVEVSWFEPGGEGIALLETILVTRLGSHSLNRSLRGLIALD